MFFTFEQNNSGGSFAYDEPAGITVNVIIEAANAAEANDKAEEIGLYFNGCRDGRDCECCGDRWYATYDDGDLKPSVYGKALGEGSPNSYGWAESGGGTAVHYKSGEIKWHDKNGKEIT